MHAPVVAGSHSTSQTSGIVVEINVDTLGLELEGSLQFGMTSDRDHGPKILNVIRGGLMDLATLA